MSWWDTRSEGYYKIMLHRHLELWNFIKEFIKDKKINSVFEVGGGYTWIPKYGINRYVGIDVNEEAQRINQDRYPMHKFIVEDFADTDTSKYRDDFDALFAIAVIEHTPKWREFLTNIVDIRPKYALVTFFNSLTRPKTSVRRYKLRNLPKCYINRYARKDVEDYLKQLGVKKEQYQIFDIRQKNWKIPNETVLLIEFERE